MVISTSVSIIAISAVMLLFFQVGPAESRPTMCSECTAEEIASCPEVVANATCQVVQMEGCSCCPTTCAGKVGDKCGAKRPPCGDSLDCLPPRIQEEDYGFDLYDPNSPSFSKGNWVCQPEITLPEDYYEDEGNDSDDELVDDEGMLCLLLGLNCPEATDKTYEDEYDGENQHENPSDEDGVIVPDLMPVEGIPDSPPRAPFPNERKPCQFHSTTAIDKSLAQGRLDRYQWLPGCYAHGRKYSPEQCLTSTASHAGRCWCVTSHGIPVTGFIERENSSMDRCNQILRSSK